MTQDLLILIFFTITENTGTTIAISRRHKFYNKKNFKPICFFVSKFSVIPVHLHQS